MKVVVDKEGRQAINKLCDVALKVGGLQNLSGVTDVLAHTINEKPPVERTPEEKTPLPPTPPTPPTPPDLEKMDETCNTAEKVLKNQNLNEVNP